VNQTLQTEVMRKLGVLVEMTQIMDRNVDDGTFGKDDSEIIYVFDTNVVQMFLQPFNNPQYAELFHSSCWGSDYEAYDLINMQSCLIMGEYLLAGRLPRQNQDGRWYMMRGHYAELKRQMGWVEFQIEQNIDRLKNDSEFVYQISEYQDLLDKVLKTETSDRPSIISIAKDQGERAGDLERLHQLAQEDFEARASAIKSRELCRLLACDQIFEPADQLRRLRSREILGKVRSFEHAFRPDRDAREAIERDMEDWDAELLEEINAKPKQYARTVKARKNDSRTLAHLQWAARQRVQINHRIVFVTGDRAIYDVYRKRAAEGAEGSPFLLRPLVQYAPLFNPSSADSWVAEREKAFALVRGALEAAMVALSLNLFGKGEPKALTRARDHFVLASQKPLKNLKWLSGFPALSEERLLNEQAPKLTALAAPLQRVERLMLGAYPTLLARRLESRERREAFLKSVASTHGAALAEALQSSLEEASRTAFMYSLPFMPEEIVKLLDRIKRGDGRLPRLLIGVRLTFPAEQPDRPDEQLTRKDIIRRLTKADCQLDTLVERLAEVPARVFALAALLAFGVEKWEAAARYADLSATASLYDRPKDGPTGESGDHFELLYMKAVGLRFTLFSREPNPAHHYYDRWAQWLLEAEDALESCIVQHRGENELSRELRAISERAAIRLAYCEWYAFGRLSETRMAEEAREVALRALGQAVEDLLACYHKRDAAAARALDDGHSGRHLSADTLHWATLQFHINTAAAILVANELALKWPELADRVEKSIEPLPRPDDWPRTEDLPPMSRAYILAATSRWRELRAIRTRGLSLPLDRVVIRGLQARVRR
jgi:hypothetical protein